MSNTAPSTNITAAQVALDINFSVNCAFVAGLCLHTYNVYLTLDGQLKFIWPRKLSIPSILFLLLQLSTMCFNIASMVYWFGTNGCQDTFPAYFFVAIGSLLCQFAQTGLSALRVYGINGRHWGVPLMICICFIPAIVETIYECTTVHGINDPPFGCNIYSSQSEVLILNKLNVVNAVTSILGAVLTLGATWHHTYRSVRLAHATGEDAPLAMLLLRDGTVYFGASLLIDIFLTAVDFIHTTDSTLILVLDALSPSFAAVILTNFLLNLKSISATSPSLTTVTSFPELQFVGPYDLGGSLVFAGTSGFLHEDTDDSEDHHS